MEPEEEGTEQKERLVLEASKKSVEAHSTHSCLHRSPFFLRCGYWTEREREMP